MPSKPLTGPMRLSILLCSSVGALALSACAGRAPAPMLTIPVAQSSAGALPAPHP